MKLLFVGHNCSRTGASLLLLEFIRWLKYNTSQTFSLLLYERGPLAASFDALLPVRYLHGDTRFHKLFKPLIHSLKLRKLGNLIKATHPTVVYVNTAVCADIIPMLADGKTVIIHHIHELKWVVEKLGVEKQLINNVPLTDHYIAASGAVADYLVKRIGVSPNRVSVIYEYAVNAPHSTDYAFDRRRQELRTSLLLESNHVLVMMCGTPEARKGTDLFLHVAALIKRYDFLGIIRFLWLGGSSNQLRPYQLMAAQVGISDICRFQSTVDNPQEWMACGDIFALTSREDPFPVVMLEAALCSMPIVCFADCGGAQEFVKHNAGIIVPKENTRKMGLACLKLAYNSNLRHAMGACAESEARTNHLVDSHAQRVYDTIVRLATQIDN